MAHEKSLIVQSRELSDFIKSARADGSISPREVSAIVGKFLCLVGHACEDFAGNAEEFADLKAAILHAYDSFVVPWDNPAISNAIEPFVDSQLRVVLDAGLGYLNSLVP